MPHGILQWRTRSQSGSPLCRSALMSASIHSVNQKKLKCRCENTAEDLSSLFGRTPTNPNLKRCPKSPTCWFSEAKKTKKKKNTRNVKKPYCIFVSQIYSNAVQWVTNREQQTLASSAIRFYQTIQNCVVRILQCWLLLTRLLPLIISEYVVIVC